MLCAPVTYVADARQTLCFWSFDAADAQPRYVKFATGTPVPVADVSSTETRPVCVPVGICPPQRLLNCERPASRSSLLVTGDDHVPCVIFSRSSHTLPASGDTDPNPPIEPSATQSPPRSRHCSPPFVYAEPVQFFW